MFCNQCGTSLPDGSKFCTDCGTALPSMVYAAAATARAAEPTKVPTSKTCRFCGADDLHPDATRCRHCMRVLTSSSTVDSPPPKMCPHCGEAGLSPAATHCRYCRKDVQPFHRKNIGWYLLGILFGLAGFAFWPLWILALLCFILGAMSNR